MKFDTIKKLGEFLDKNTKGKVNWVTALPVYQHIYNTTKHKCLGGWLTFPLTITL